MNTEKGAEMFETVLILLTSLMLGLLGMQILIYKETLLENHTNVFAYATLSYLCEMKELWKDSRIVFLGIIILLTIFGWIIFFLSLFPTVILKTFRIIKARNKLTDVFWRHRSFYFYSFLHEHLISLVLLKCRFVQQHWFYPDFISCNTKYIFINLLQFFVSSVVVINACS